PDEPRCRDYSEGYQAEYHEHMAKILMERPYLWSTHVWNMFDFGCAARNEGGTAGRNNKGLVTMDRQIKKEAFFVYKAYWSKEPFVYLCGRRYARRAGETTHVKAYSNQSQVSLYVNGELFTTSVGSRVFLFEDVPLEEGFTYLTAVAGGAGNTDVSDTITLERVEEKPAIYTLPKEEGAGDGVANWFDKIETVASDAPMEYSDTHYSVHDKINDILANEEAYQILSAALSSISGMKLNKGMLAMMGGKTLAEMTETLRSMGNPPADGSSEDTSGSPRRIPENALQIINSELNKIQKHH
ncbi:MAG: glycoside hydrolase family 2 protein, partial [Butyrivibrio sp.]|nr:glycoside hydrolase family 2 protein [Butyrivibrio sp.]